MNLTLATELLTMTQADQDYRQGWFEHRDDPKWREGWKWRQTAAGRMNPTLFITLGMPASGKTYFAERLAAELGVFFLNCDALRIAMIDQPTFRGPEHQLVFRTADFIAEQHLAQGQSIISEGNYES